jgi:hypothetical protein
MGWNRKPMNKNYLQFNSGESARPVFRIVSCERFMQMLQSRTNGLVRPKLWDDPFENFVLNGIAVASDGTKARFGYRDALFGQCWSFHIETDAMWRIYSPHDDKRGVKLKTTIPGLYSSLYSNGGQFRDISCFIGRVTYLNKAGITKALATVNVTDSSGCGIAATLLIKRKAFAPEREVRLIYFSQEKTFTADVFTYPIDPNTLFQEAVLDPRLSGTEVADWKAKFASAGFTKRVIQSGLYKAPKDIFINI